MAHLSLCSLSRSMFGVICLGMLFVAGSLTGQSGRTSTTTSNRNCLKSAGALQTNIQTDSAVSVSSCANMRSANGICADATQDNQGCKTPSQSRNRIAQGSKAPQFELMSLDGGQKMTNEDFAGKYLLIDFWWTGCSYCVKEIKHLKEVYRLYKDRDFAILSVSLDERPETVQRFRKQREPMPWYNAHVADPWNSQIVRNFHVDDVPKAFLISPEGDIVASGKQLLGNQLVETVVGFMERRNETNEKPVKPLIKKL